MAAKILTCLFFGRFLVFYAILSTLCTNVTSHSEQFDPLEENGTKYPTVMAAILVRNKAHSLPFFFGQLEKLDYPKDRIAIWIRSDHNTDNSTSMIREWIAGTEHLYNSIQFTFEDSPTGYENENSPCEWTDERFTRVIQLREKALTAARLMWADYLLMLDADVMLEHPRVLQILMGYKQTVVAPMLTAVVGKTYSNYWGDMDESGYYKRIPEYFKVLEREFTGIYAVPMVHTAFLVDMRHKNTDNLSYVPPKDNELAEDDIIMFAFSAKRAGITMHVVNTEHFGQIMVPLESYHSLYVEWEQFTYMRIELLDADNPDMGPGVDYMIEDRGLSPSPHIHLTPMAKDSLGFDKVYMINLERRPERRERMEHVFDVLGIEAEWRHAVDGKQLNDTYLYEDLGIEVVPGFTDPYGGRPMTMGEIGCFLSHYFIWEDIVKQGYEEVVVFEDDLRFEPYFRSKLSHIMKIVKQKTPDWDLIYLGRKRLNRRAEKYLEGTVDNLVWPSYSYWTLSYLLSIRGARKLLAQRPLQKLLPVDEYLPVMFDQHPEGSWKEPFEPRDLVALSAEPLLIYPTHYLGESNYISDTEYSELITEKTDHNKQEDPQGAPESPQGASIHSTNENGDTGETTPVKGPKADNSGFSSHLQDEL